MHVRKDTEKIFNSTGTLYRKNSLKQAESLRATPEPKSALNNSGKRGQVLRRGDSESSLANIIEEKVTSLKMKFGELSGLRKKLVESGNVSSEHKLSSTARPRIKSENGKKKTEIMQGKIFISDDRRTCITQNTESASEYHEKELKKPYFNPNFEKLLFDHHPQLKIDPSAVELKVLKSELETLKQKLLASEKALQTSEKALQTSEKALQTSEKSRINQESILNSQSEDLRVLLESNQTLQEKNKALRLQLNRLESKVKTIDDKKATNTSAIRNLSYIILSKDSPGKDSPTKCEPSGNNITLKYLETLNELHNSDQFTMSILMCLKRNQAKDAYKLLLDMQETLNERIERTRKNVEDLEDIVYECKSPLSPSKISEIQLDYKKTESFASSDLISFMKCEAAMIEELLMVS